MTTRKPPTPRKRQPARPRGEIPDPIKIKLRLAAIGVHVCPCLAELFALKKRWPSYVEAEAAARNMLRLAAPALNPLPRA